MRCEVVKQYVNSGGTFEITDWSRYKRGACGDKRCNTCSSNTLIPIENFLKERGWVISHGSAYTSKDIDFKIPYNVRGTYGLYQDGIYKDDYCV